MQASVGSDGVTVWLHSGGERHSATVPCAGVVELSDVEKAGALFQSVLEGLPVAEQHEIDRQLVDISGSELATMEPSAAIALVTAASMAACNAGAAAKGVSLYHHIAELAGKSTDDFVVPIPFMAVASGGKRADNHLPAQDILVCGNNALTYAHAMELGSEVIAALHSSLTEIWGVEPEYTAIGSIAPPEEDISESIQLVFEAIQQAGLGERVTMGLHVAPGHGLFSGTPGSVDLYDLNYKTPDVSTGIPVANSLVEPPARQASTMW